MSFIFDTCAKVQSNSDYSKHFCLMNGSVLRGTIYSLKIPYRYPSFSNSSNKNFSSIALSGNWSI